MEDVILMDNLPNSYRLQKENALPISSWQGDYNDEELSRLTPLLINWSMDMVQDVRDILGNSHQNHQLDLKRAMILLSETPYFSSKCGSQSVRRE